MRDAVKSGETGFPHTHVHEASTSAELVEGIEAAAGGSPATAAAKAANSGLEPKMQVGSASSCVAAYLTGVQQSGMHVFAVYCLPYTGFEGCGLSDRPPSRAGCVPSDAGFGCSVAACVALVTPSSS
jgi:hypothetical protein